MSEPCPECGGHRWSHDGICLEMACAGSIFDPGWPRSDPQERVCGPERGVQGAKEARPPRSIQGRKSAEMWYESRGEKPPWET